MMSIYTFKKEQYRMHEQLDLTKQDILGYSLFT